MAVPTEEGAPEEAGHGSSLLMPSDVTESLRVRRERPAELGRYILAGLGAVGVGAGVGLWLAAPLDRLFALAILAFGAMLVAFGGVLHLVLRRDRERTVEEVHAWAEGIELLQRNGELRAAAWTDPALALDIFVRPRANSADSDRLLLWKMGPTVPPCDLSEAGLARILKEVTVHDLRLAEYRSGRREREPRAYEIRGRPHDGPHPSAGLSARTPGPDR